ncbi:MAG: ABC transporter ATP-binding protein [Bacteroidota bacterium]|nr:ABC transporter ATP-binding protein [Bacteroidota bacterium]
MSLPLVEVNEVKKWFPVRSGLLDRSVQHVHAVDGVSFHILRGEVLGLVGESGCGKSTLGRVILYLLHPTEGSICFEGRDVGEMRRRDLRLLRKSMQMIFQDPYSSLNPRMTVGSALHEVLHVHGLATRSQSTARIDELLRMVGLNSFHARRYPHEFSSGQRQRIGIARALAVEPRFIVCDEPVSALDVSIQAQILNLLQDLREALDLTYLFISHDLAVVRHIADRIAVMYLGRIVEIGAVEDVVHAPLHPYTEALLAAAPVPDPEHSRIPSRIGCDVPSPVNIPPGCPFHTRCPDVFADCRRVVPRFGNLPNGRRVACLKYTVSHPAAERPQAENASPNT